MSRKEGGRGLACLEISVDASIQQLQDYIKNRRRPETIQTAQVSTQQKWPENKNRMKNNCMDISSDKQAKPQTRKFGHGENWFSSEYKTRHDWVAKAIPGNCARNWNLTVRINSIYKIRNSSRWMRPMKFYGILKYKRLTFSQPDDQTMW